MIDDEGKVDEDDGVREQPLWTAGDVVSETDQGTCLGGHFVPF